MLLNIQGHSISGFQQFKPLGNNLECYFCACIHFYCFFDPTEVQFLDIHLGERCDGGFDPRINLPNFGFHPGSGAGLGYRSVELTKVRVIANSMCVFPDKLVTKVT